MNEKRFRRIRAGFGVLPSGSHAGEHPSNLLTDDRLAVLFLFEELVDEYIPLGELWRIAESVRQSVIDARRGAGPDFISGPASYVAAAWIGELFRGDGMAELEDGPELDDGAELDDDQGGDDGPEPY